MLKAKTANTPKTALDRQGFSLSTHSFIIFKCCVTASSELHSATTEKYSWILINGELMPSCKHKTLSWTSYVSLIRIINVNRKSPICGDQIASTMIQGKLWKSGQNRNGLQAEEQCCLWQQLTHKPSIRTSPVPNTLFWNRITYIMFLGESVHTPNSMVSRT